MNSVQESKNELDAAIRYAENAISSAKQTIESMEFRQEMAKKQHSEQTGREQALERELKELEEARGRAEGEVELLQSSIKQLERELTVKTANANAWKKEYDKLKDKLRLDKVCAPTMPIIPKAVAIAIFREGMQHGVESACTELEGQTITVSESGYTGDFEVSFERSIHLDDELDLDWMRGKVGDYGENFVLDCLSSLCADNKFECRIHGVDAFDQGDNENEN